MISNLMRRAAPHGLGRRLLTVARFLRACPRRLWGRLLGQRYPFPPWHVARAYEEPTEAWIFPRYEASKRGE
jgi:hypothetical protein